MNLGDAVKDAKKRREPSGYRFSICDGIQLVNHGDWDSVTENASLFFDRKVLQTIESDGPQGLRYRYALIYDADRPVAAICCQLLTIHGNQLTPIESDKNTAENPFKSSTKKFKEKSLEKLRRNVMICGNLMSWGPHGIHISENTDQTKIWDGIAEALYRIRRGDRLNGQIHYVMIKDCLLEEPERKSRLERYRYRRHETEPNMVLSIDPEWSSFDDYLASLNKKYRKAAKNVYKSIDQSDLTVERHKEISNNDIAAIHGLYLQTHSKADVRLFKLRETYLSAIAKAAGSDSFRCTILRNSQSKVVGFVTTLKDSETAIGYYIGVDRETNAGAPVYHRLLYAIIEDSLDLGCMKISFGRTALEPKARLGCTPEPMSISIRHRVPVLNMLIQPILGAIPHDDAPERSPFKAKSATANK